MKTEHTERGAKGLIMALLLAVIMIAGMGIPSYATVNGPGFTWNYGDWSSRVAWEARYALSKRADGTSAFQLSNDKYGQRWIADWNYANDDSHALNRASAEAGWVVGTVGYQKGGWCTFFGRLVLFRSTYWAGYGIHLTTPGFPSSVYSKVNGCCMTDRYETVQPGWIFATVTATPNHYAVADKREVVNGRIGWWFIDSNYVDGYAIGRHFMPDDVLRAQGYRAWRPDWATYNW